VSDAATRVPEHLIRTGNVTPYTFPIRPSSVGLGRLDDAADEGRAAAEAEVSWLFGGASVGAGAESGPTGDVSSTRRRAIDTDGLRRLVAAAIGGFSPEVLRVRRAPDGTLVTDPAGDVHGDDVVDALHSGGGVLLRRAERIDEALNTLAASASVARMAHVEIAVLLGSLPDPAPLPEVARWHAVAMTDGVVVRGEDGAPVDAVPGAPHVVDGPVRVYGHADAVTLLVGEVLFDDVQRHRMLTERAVCHPLLRVDLPAIPDGPVEMYGVGTVAVLDHVNAQLDHLRRAAPDEDAAFWWLHRFPLAPVALDRQLAVGPAVRGRFPGGVGMMERADGRLVLVAAGQVLHGADSHVPLLERLLRREVVTVEAGSSDEASISVLVRCGLVEPVLADAGE
jgi:hypothetical protein